MHDLDFERDGQSYRFVDLSVRRGRKFYVFRTECAICRKPFNSITPSWTLTPGRRCKAHALRGVPVGSTTEARRIKSKGWEVVAGSVVAKLWAAGVVRNAGRPRSDPRPAEKAKKEPPPRQREAVTPTKRQMAAARAEKVRRRKARSVEKSVRV